MYEYIAGYIIIKLKWKMSHGHQTLDATFYKAFTEQKVVRES